MIFVVMGVCGCGKTTVGRMLAGKLGATFIEGDDLHPPANREKMSGGIALTDEDRWPWLEAIAAQAARSAQNAHHVVVSCSALRRVYRDRLREAGDSVRFIHLTGDKALLARRMAQRRGHFMPPGLLDSQLATLETPDVSEAVLTLNIADDPDRIVEVIVNTHVGAQA